MPCFPRDSTVAVVIGFPQCVVGLVSLGGVAGPAISEKLKVFLYVGYKALVQNIEMHFVVRIEKAFSLKVGKDGVEEIKCVFPEPFSPDGQRKDLVCLQ